MVLHPVGVVDAVVDHPLHGLEGDLFAHAGGNDPTRLLPHSGLVPARVFPAVTADVESVVDGDGPDPRRGAVRHAILAER